MQHIADNYATVSVRFAQPLSYFRVLDFKEKSKDELQTSYVAFWNDRQKKPVVNEFRNRLENVDTIYFCGAGEALMPSTFIAGGNIPTAAKNGCVLSSAVAFALFGAMDVTGFDVTVDHAKYTLYGVYEDNAKVIYIQDRLSAVSSYCNVEIKPISISNYNDEIVDFIDKYYYSAQVMDGPFITKTTSLLTQVPLLVLFVGLLYTALKKQRTSTNRVDTANRIAWVCILVGVFYSIIEKLLPVFYTITPTKWSNFSYWGNASRSIMSELLHYLSLRPTYRDVDLNYQLILMGVCTLLITLMILILFHSIESLQINFLVLFVFCSIIIVYCNFSYLAITYWAFILVSTFILKRF